MEETELADLGHQLKEWARRHDVLRRAEEKGRESLSKEGSRSGVPFEEIELAYSGMRLHFDLNGQPDLPPAVEVSFSIAYKEPSFRDLSEVGRFRAKFGAGGVLQSSRLEIDGDVLHERRRVPA